MEIDWEMAGWTILVAIFCNLSCALLGCYLVLRRMSLMGDAISHAVLPGIVLAVLLSGSLSGWPVLVGAVLVGTLTTFLTQLLQTSAHVNEDSSLGVVFTGLFAFGVILISLFAGNAHIDTDCVLYGELATVPLSSTALWGISFPSALVPLGFVLLGTLAFITLYWKELQAASFDPDWSSTAGINSVLMHYLLMIVVAVATVASFEAVGSILVIAMLVVPAATAYLWTDRMHILLIISGLCGTLSAIFGYFLALYFETNIAGMMAVCAGGILAFTVFFAPQYGVIMASVRRLKLSIRIWMEDILAGLYRLEEAHQPTADWGEWIRFAGNRFRGWLTLPLMRYSGLVNQPGPGLWQLTPMGRQRAESLVRAHRLWESFLEKHFQLPLDHLHSPAEKIEHYIGDDLQKKLAAELPGLESDPHGKKIP